ncbi:hypothetical protein N9O85_02410 [Porticoccaceae bacterium]|nr:hypothetical protein [Porticoccaceae bacterium]
MTEVYVPIEAIAEKFSVSKITIRKWLKSGAISEKSFIKVGSTYRFMMSSVLSDLKGGSSTEIPQVTETSPDIDRDSPRKNTLSDVESEGEASDWEVVCKNLFWQFKLYEELIYKMLCREFFEFKEDRAANHHSIGTYEPWFATMIQECLEIIARIKVQPDIENRQDSIYARLNEIVTSLSGLEADLKTYLEDQTRMLLDIQRLSTFFSTELGSKAFYNGSPETWEEFLEKTPDGLILNSDWQDSFEIFLDNHEFYLELNDLPRVDFGMVDD